MVAAGILLSRLLGLVRQRAFAHYLGNGAVADAFTAGFRIPNLLQNLFGEGALSASFIPVYAGHLARGERAEADRTAGAVFGLLSLVMAAMVLLGVYAAPLLVAVIAPGFDGSTRQLTIDLVRLFFPGAGLLVLSAWCLGILNSHRRFFLSYAAPVAWNVAIIAALVLGGGRLELPSLARLAAWGALVGSGLQFAVQLPAVIAVGGRVRPTLRLGFASIRTVVTNFVPAFLSRGVLQVSVFIDQIIATLLPIGAVASLGYAQTIALLPVSLFGMSISAAELPAMAGSADAEGLEAVRSRLNRGLRQIAFFVVPSAVAFATLGHVLAGALYQTGQFTAADTRYVWGILAGSSVGLLATTLARLYGSTYYALRDTRTPFRYSLVRVAIGIVLGLTLGLAGPGLLGLDAKWGAAGLTISAGIAGWLEFFLLRRTLNQRIGPSGLPLGLLVRLWSAALIGAAVAWGVLLGVPSLAPITRAVATLIPFGLAYLGVTLVLAVPEARRLLAAVPGLGPKEPSGE